MVGEVLCHIGYVLVRYDEGLAVIKGSSYCLTPDGKPAGSVIYSNTPLILILVNSLTRINIQTNINWNHGSILIHDFKTYNLPNLIKIMYFIQIKVDTSFFFVKNLI